MKRDIYQAITDRFIEQLKNGTVPWQQPWTSCVQNIISRKSYRGINAFTLGMTNHTSPYWLTFKQALDLGGHVKKGEKSLPVIYYKILEKRDDAGNLKVREDGKPDRVRAEWTVENGGKTVPDLARVNAQSLSALFCSPTMELGVDISELSIVHMRNAPPNAANYAQRSGRAGRSGQAALVFTYCSSYSPHDRHYFGHRQDLVAGAVEPPRLDITNRDLIRSHLHAVFMTRVGLKDVRLSALEVIDLDNPSLPLRDEILSAVTLNESTIELLIKHFKTVLVDKPTDPKLAWCDNAWISKQLRSLPETLDRTMDRWRTLYREALATLNKATAILDSGLFATTTEEHKRAKREIFQGQRQIDLLKNQFQKGGEQSEFYIFRYLAAEGFLPGYNFTRLPIRAFLTDGHERGEFISRPRLIALREFGPRNVIYYNGQKYVVSQAVIPSVEENLRNARVCNASGYWLDQGQETIETCPITGTDLSEPKNKTEVAPLLALCEMLARRREHITCEEEERSRQGFDTETYFSLDGGDKSQMRRALVQHGGETLLKMSYMPAARLIQLSRKDRREKEIGYRIVGDDKAVCTEAKKLNKEERKQLSLFHGTDTAPWDRLGNLPAAMLEVDRIRDDTAAGLHAKEERYAELIRSTGYLGSRFLADAWCAAFVWKKTRDLPYPITNDVLRKIERNPHDCAPWMRAEIERLRDHYQFFHWHLAFPEVFPVPEKSERPDNEHAGWNGGFDVMLGNPPWERVKLQEKEWFAERRPDIAEAPNASARKRLIERLAQDDPALFAAFGEAARQAEGESHILRDSGLYPLCGRGDVNLYAVFAESMRQHLKLVGRTGAVLPSGIATDDTTKLFFQSLVDTRTLVIVVETHVLVATPEKLDAIIRQAPELVSGVKLFVIDEGHLAGDVSNRGSRSRGRRAS